MYAQVSDASECKHIIRLVAMRWRGLKRRLSLSPCSSFPLFLTADGTVSFFSVLQLLLVKPEKLLAGPRRRWKSPKKVAFHCSCHSVVFFCVLPPWWCCFSPFKIFFSYPLLSCHDFFLFYDASSCSCLMCTGERNLNTHDFTQLKTGKYKCVNGYLYAYINKFCFCSTSVKFLRVQIKVFHVLSLIKQK